MFRSPVLMVLILVAFVFILIGCSEEDIVTPPIGMIIINATPTQLATPWSLKLPDGLFAVGDTDTTLLDMIPGQYTLTWLAVDGWSSPEPISESKTLVANRTLAFQGAYQKITTSYGIIVVDPDPETVVIPWNITGPNTFSITGSGDSTLINLELGDYTLTWQDVTGWERLGDSVETGTLTAETRLVFNSTYQEQTGSIRVSPLGNPTAPWQLIVQDTLSTIGDLELDTLYIHNGSGSQTLTDLSSGNYIIVWNDVVDYLTPPTLTYALPPGTDLVISDTYVLQYTPIIAGAFSMGDIYSNDETAHPVALTHNFLMRTTEITVREYCDMLNWAKEYGEVIGNTPIIDIIVDLTDSDFSKIKDLIDGSNEILFDFGSSYSDISFDDKLGFSYENGFDPLMKLSWYAAATYCDWLNIQAGDAQSYDHADWSVVGGDVYALTGWRLPTEAEWEYACRAGTTTAFNTGVCLDADSEANYYGVQPLIGCPSGSFNNDTVATASYTVNGFGIYDMHGNVAEWCWDLYGPDYYSTSPGTDPPGPVTGSERVVRGGSYNDGALNCRSAARHAAPAGTMRSFIGFRIVKTN